MARISMVPQETSDPMLRHVFDVFLKQRGAVPNLFRILAHLPGTLDAFGKCFQTIMSEGAVDLGTKELVALAVSRANSSDY